MKIWVIKVYENEENNKLEADDLENEKEGKMTRGEKPAIKYNYKDEYLDVSANMRHFGNMRFAELTLFIASLAGFLAIIFRTDSALEPDIRLILKLGGLSLTITFFIMEERIKDYWICHKERAVELEKKLGFKQYSISPPRRIITATNAIRMLFIFIIFLWIILIIKHPSI